MRYLDRVKDIPARVKLSLQAADEGWSVKETEKQVNQALGHPEKGNGKGKNGDPAVKEVPPDPLADFWPEANSMNEYLGMHSIEWGVDYGHHEVMKKGGKSVGFPAWTFWRGATSPTPKAELKKWFLAMADVMGDTQEEEERFNKVRDAATAAYLARQAQAAPPPEPSSELRVPSSGVEPETRNQKPGTAAEAEEPLDAEIVALLKEHEGKGRVS
jgi:hypothetical protein